MAHLKALRWLQEHPTVFQSLQAGAVMGTGDIIAQKLIEKKEELNKGRLAAMTGFGLFVAGPVMSTWYYFLDKRLPFCWHRLKRSLVKMVADQTIMAPTLLLVIISYLELTVGSGTFEGVKEELDKKYKNILINNYKVWPAVQTLNFTFTPLQYQVLVAQLVGVAWSAYLSYAKNGSSGENENKDEQVKET